MSGQRKAWTFSCYLDFRDFELTTTCTEQNARMFAPRSETRARSVGHRSSLLSNRPGITPPHDPLGTGSRLPWSPGG